MRSPPRALRLQHPHTTTNNNKKQQQEMSFVFPSSRRIRSSSKHQRTSTFVTFRSRGLTDAILSHLITCNRLDLSNNALTNQCIPLLHQRHTQKRSDKIFPRQTKINNEMQKYLCKIVSVINTNTTTNEPRTPILFHSN